MKPNMLPVLFILAVVLPLQVAAIGVLDRVKTTKTLAIAYSPNAYPISFKGDAGEPRGYSVDLCKRIAASIQRDLGLDKLEVRWIEGNTPRRLAAVANGEVDMECGTSTVNLARQAQVDFSNIVFVESGGILTRAASGIEALSDLAGKRLAVVPQTTTEKRLRKELNDRLINAELVPIKDSKDGRERLVAGEVDAVAGDRLVLIGQIAQAGDVTDFAILETEFSLDPYAFALKRNDADFRLAVNRGLAQVYRGDEIDRIFQRWFGEDAEPTDLLGAIFFLYGFVD